MIRRAASPHVMPTDARGDDQIGRTTTPSPAKEKGSGPKSASLEVGAEAGARESLAGSPAGFKSHRVHHLDIS